MKYWKHDVPFFLTGTFQLTFVFKMTVHVSAFNVLVIKYNNYWYIFVTFTFFIVVDQSGDGKTHLNKKFGY